MSISTSVGISHISCPPSSITVTNNNKAASGNLLDYEGGGVGTRGTCCEHKLLPDLRSSFGHRRAQGLWCAVTVVYSTRLYVEYNLFLVRMDYGLVCSVRIKNR